MRLYEVDANMLMSRCGLHGVAIPSKTTKQQKTIPPPGLSPPPHTARSLSPPPHTTRCSNAATTYRFIPDGSSRILCAASKPLRTVVSPSSESMSIKMRLYLYEVPAGIRIARANTVVNKAEASRPPLFFPLFFSSRGQASLS